MTAHDQGNTPRHSYDRIAHLYDLDMARNMAFDDVGCYVAIVRRARGRVLELGCGNGRIFLPLLADGADAFGIDHSAAMLGGLVAKAAPAQNRVARMDARSLAFDSDFACVLCPYSLITYMTMAEDLQRLVDEAVRVLRPGGILVADAFIPRDSAPCADYRLDYQRPCFDGILSRSKRVTAVAPDINRIERHYEVRDAGGAIIDLIDTVEDIRTFTPENLAAAWRHPAMHIEATLWDYHAQPRPAAAQFCTLILRKAAP